MKTSAVLSCLGTSRNKLTHTWRKRRIVSAQVNDLSSVYVSDKSAPPRQHNR